MTRMPHQHRVRTHAILIAIAVVALTLGSRQLFHGSVLAQTDPTDTTPTESFSVYAGDTLELVTANTDPSPQYSWVLSKDRMFVGATRDPIFRARLTDAGSYRLDASVQSSDGSNASHRTILFDVKQRPLIAGSDSGAVTQESTGTLLPLLSTDPSDTMGTLALPDNLHVVRFTPLRTDTTSLDLTVQTPTTPNATGSTVSLSANTYFRTDELPLYVWFVSPTDGMQVHAVASLHDGTTLQQDFTIRTSAAGPQTSSGSYHGMINATASSDGSLQFSLTAAPVISTAPVFYRWDFGDGSRSLLEKPHHTFLQSGTYVVEVDMTDLTTGRPIGTARQSFTIQVITTQATSSSSSVSDHSSSALASSHSSSKTKTATASTSLIWPILIVTFWILVILAVLVAAVWVVRKLLSFTGGLQEHLERAESQIVKNQDEKSRSVIDVPAPMQIRRPDVQDAEEEELPEEKPSAPEATVPQHPVAPPDGAIDVEHAPAWLRKGLEKSETPEDRPQVVTNVPVSAAPTPSPEPEDKRGESLPPWLASVPQQQSEPPTVQQKSDETVPPTPIVPEPIQEVVPAPQSASSPQPPQAPLEPPSSEPQQTAATPVVEEPEVVAPPIEPVSPPPPPAPAVEFPAPIEETTTDQPTDDAALAREERERERKRAKRLRYRQNLKKRKLELEQAIAEPAPATKETEVIASIVQEPELELPAPTEPTALPSPISSSPAPDMSVSNPAAEEKKDDQVIFVVEAQGISPEKKPPEEKTAPPVPPAL